MGLGNEAAMRRITARIAGAIAASLLVLGVCASGASAEPLSMTFTEARANVGDQLSDDALFEPPATAPFAAQIDAGSGVITGGILQVPRFSTHITEPVVADVTVDFKIGVITGSFSAATGALSLSGEAGGTLTANGHECTVSVTPDPLTLTTSGSSGGANPRSGSPFVQGLSGPGAIAGEWTDMQATPVEPGVSEDEAACEVAEHHIEGPGGVWLAQAGHSLPLPPPPPGPNPTPVCRVPRLKGMAPARAKAAIKAHHCIVGKIRRSRRGRGMKAGLLVVKTSNPHAGKVLAAGAKVNLRLGPKPGQPRP